MAFNQQAYVLGMKRKNEITESLAGGQPEEISSRSSVTEGGKERGDRKVMKGGMEERIRDEVVWNFLWNSETYIHACLSVYLLLLGCAQLKFRLDQ